MIIYAIYFMVTFTLALLYIYLGYPILLWILSFFFAKPSVKKRNVYPNVTLIVSCYNEEQVIQDKINNSLKLSYGEEQLSILFVSDGSTDQTDEIIKQNESSRLRLLRVDGRLGKTECLNRAVEFAKGEIIVFSDANAMYHPDAIKRLVENFYDQTVGYVVGLANYSDNKDSLAAISEKSYWKYEIFIKKMESRLHSVVGADGAMYAIRKNLYTKLLPTDINDFVNPLQIIEKGYRGVFEPDAICSEDASDSFEKEFGRKIRIVNRSFSGLLRVKSVLNIAKYGFFSFEICSHKILRWFSPIFVLGLLTSTIILSINMIEPFPLIAILMFMFFFFANIGYFLSENNHVWPIIFAPYYFTMVNFASLIGVVRTILGRNQITWETVRSKGESNKISVHYVLLLQCLLLIFMFIVLPLRLIFWSFFFVTFFVYFGYPVILYIKSLTHTKPIEKGDIYPTISLLISAFNEEEIIEEKLLNSLELDYPEDKLTIIISSDGSTDRTVDIASKFVSDQIVLYDYKIRKGKIGVILNTVSKVKTDIIVFSDANTMYAKDAMKKIVRNFNDPNVGAVSADVILENEKANFGKSESVYYRYERWIQKRESEIDSIVGADGGMYAIRRELFVPPLANTILDDFVISMNIVINGKRLIYDIEAKGYEKNLINNRTEYLRKSRVVAGAIQALKNGQGIPGIKQKWFFFAFFSHKLLRWFIPLFIIILLVSNVLIVFTSPDSNYVFPLYGQIGFYALAIIGMMIPKLNNVRIVGIPFYFCMVNGAALYGLYKGLFNKQEVTWKKFSRISIQ